MDFLDNRVLSGIIGQPMNKPTVPGTNIRVPRWLDPRRVYQNPIRILDPTGVRGGILTGQAVSEIGERIGMPERDRAFLEGALTTPGGPALKLLVGFIAGDMYRPAFGSMYDESGELTRDAYLSRRSENQQYEPPKVTNLNAEEPVKPERGSTGALPGQTEKLSSPTPQPESQPEPVNELAKAYLDTEIRGKELENTGELQRRLFEGGALGKAATFDDVMTWTKSNPGLAYRVAQQKGLLD